jgi:hypothetical protein
MIKFRVRSDRWQQLHPGVYATFSGIPGRGAWLWAALLAAGRADLQGLIVAAAGGDHSVLEFRYHRDVERAHGLPESARQVPFTTPGGRRGRRDRVYEPFGLVIELDGRLAHQPENQGKDKTRDNAAAADGKQTLRYGWSQVKWQSCETAAQVARVLRRRGWDGRPRPCSPGCPVQQAAGQPEPATAPPVRNARARRGSC